MSLLTAACASGSPIGVERVDPRLVQHSISANAVADGVPSDDSRIVLEELGLTSKYADDPVNTLAALHGLVVDGRRGPGTIFALAELSFLHAARTGERPYYLATVVYAWVYLFPGAVADEPSRFDRRLRGAVDLYNLALAEALKSEDRARVAPRSAVLPLPFGELEVVFDEATQRWRGRELEDFVSVADFEIRGLRARYRRSGLGAPLAASYHSIDPGTTTYDLLGERVKVPVTVFLRLPSGRQQLTAPRLRGDLSLHVAGEAETVTVEGQPIPLELDPTAAVAYALDDSPMWSREFGGFFKSLIANPGARAHLGAITPYQAGLIPVVLVHGTASSPARWAQMYNRLANSARIRGRYQFWFFAYDTGAPIPYSARVLRDALTEAVRTVDPEGRDPALRHMVLIGHSQGGLLVKMTVISTGSVLWDGVSKQPLDELKISEAERQEVRSMMFFEPLPFVERVIFMSTPHRGSFQARNVVAELFRRIVTLPVGVGRTMKDLAEGNPDAFRVADASPTLTSLDNMNPLRPFIKTLATIPVVPRVHAHSIIAVKGDGPVEDGDDGVVKYQSAYIDGVESTLIVHSGHSTQETPEGIEEVLRILELHAAATR